MEPDVPGEGESDGGTQPTSGNKSNLKRKRDDEEEEQNKRRT
jgi:hypothetical protein